MANLKNINFMSGTQFTNLEKTNEDELYAVNIENDAAFRSFVSGMGMPSSKNVNLTLGDSGSTYTAPANGYFYITGKCTANYQFVNIVSKFATTSSGGNGSSVDTFVPVKKGDAVTVWWTANSVNLKFIYAEGEVY